MKPVNIVCGPIWNDVLGYWIANRTGGQYIPGRSQQIGSLNSEGKVRAVSQFSDCNGRSMLLHCAGEGPNWLTREFIFFTFHYAFVQIEVEKLISPVESGNIASRRFVRRMGFSLEATLKDCAPSGDLLLYTMSRNQCRWLTSLRDYNGKAKSTRAA